MYPKGSSTSAIITRKLLKNVILQNNVNTVDTNINDMKNALEKEENSGRLRLIIGVG